MEEGKGVEPSGVTPAWFSRPVAHHWALPSMVGLAGLEPAASASRSGALTKLRYNPMVPLTGFEPASTAS